MAYRSRASYRFARGERYIPRGLIAGDILRFQSPTGARIARLRTSVSYLQGALRENSHCPIIPAGRLWLATLQTGTGETRLLELTSDRLRAIADPTRIRILAMLERNEATVQELTDPMDTTHQNMSRHLSVLHRSGIVTRRKQGTRVYYALADYSACLLIRQAIAGLTAHIEETAEAIGLGH